MRGGGGEGGGLGESPVGRGGGKRFEIKGLLVSSAVGKMLTLTFKLTDLKMRDLIEFDEMGRVFFVERSIFKREKIVGIM